VVDCCGLTRVMLEASCGMGRDTLSTSISVISSIAKHALNNRIPELLRFCNRFLTPLC